MRKIIKLECEEGTGEYYTTTVHERAPEKLRRRKYSRKLRRHAWFVEKKIK